jgi:IS30 family transposase
MSHLTEVQRSQIFVSLQAGMPKKINFDEVDNKHIEFVQNKINNRPRKKLGFLTPNEKVLLILQNNKVAFVT